MAPVCVRVAFIGGGQGEPSRWPTAWGASRCAAGVRDCCEPKRKKLRGKHEGIRIGPLTGHMGRSRTSMTNARQAKARRRFRNRRFRYVTRAAGRGPEESKRRVPGGNRQSGGTKTKPRKPNDFNGFRGSNPGGGYEIRTREAVTPTRFPSVRHRPLGESSIALFAAAFWPQQTTQTEYHRLADKQNRRVLCVCRAWRLARPGSLWRSDARIQ